MAHGYGPAPRWNSSGYSPGFLTPQRSQMPQTTSGSHFSSGWSARGASPRPPQSYMVGSGPGSSYTPQGFLAGPVSDTSSWVPDSGATHHITNDSASFQDDHSASGSDQVFMGNGEGVSIKNVGSACVPSPINPHTTLVLKNLLLVPSITKNLVSVQKFCKDNCVFFEFHETSCCVKSQVTEAIMVQGIGCVDGLYTFQAFHPAPTSSVSDKLSKPSQNSLCNFVSTISSNNVQSATVIGPTLYDLWHARYGHPHHEALKHALTQCNVPVPIKYNFTFCQACCLGKSHRLSSHSSSIVYTFPLELVFIDLWGPASR